MDRIRYFMAGVLGILLIALVFFISYRATSIQRQNRYSMFSWEDEIVLAEERTNLISVSKQMHIGTIYQAFSKDILDTDATVDFLKELFENQIEVYYLTGAEEWGFEREGSSLKEEILLVDQMNQKLEENMRFKGIVVDIEPYNSGEWKEASDDKQTEFFENYVNGIVEAYGLASEKGLTIIVCIPNFYERYSERGLEYLVSEGCDGIAVMNYDRTDEINQIKNEVRIAQKYKKQIICIAELQKPGYHELEEINSYYNAGLDALKESWEKTMEWFQYSEMGFSYHYYLPLKELLENESNP